MKTWMVAALVAVATVAAIAAAYGVGVVAGLQAGVSGAAPIGQEPQPERSPAASGVGQGRGLSLRDGAVLLGPFDSVVAVEVRCASGELAVGGGRLGSVNGLRVVDERPVAGSVDVLRPIGWRVEAERTDPDRSPRALAAYVVCRAG